MSHDDIRWFLNANKLSPDTAGAWLSFDEFYDD